MADNRDSQLGLLFVIPSILIQLLCIPAISSGLGFHPGLWQVIALVCTTTLVTGLSFIARSKGYSPLLGLLACFGPIGLLMLLCLPDRRCAG